MIGVYTITNKIDNKIYVGYSTTLYERLSDHLVDLRGNYHKNSHLQAAFNLYGEENFVFEPLNECEEKDLCSEENLWCNLLNTHNRKYGYNIAPTNPHGKSKKVAEESKLKMSLAKKGKKLTEEHRLKVIKAITGRKYSEETKQKISKANKGRKFPEEFGKRHSEKLKVLYKEGKIVNYNKGKPLSEETRRKLSLALTKTGITKIQKEASERRKQFKEELDNIVSKLTIPPKKKQKKWKVNKTEDILKRYENNSKMRSENAKKHLCSPDFIQNRNTRKVKIFQYDINWNFIKEWESFKPAEDWIKSQFTEDKIINMRFSASKMYVRRFGYMWSRVKIEF